MTTWIALLRGINVGGHRKVKMAELRAGLEAAGLVDPATYIQSGNIVCVSDRTADEVAEIVAAVLDADFGLDDVPIVVRSAAELAAVVDANPFTDAEAEPKLLHVYFCDEPVEQAALERLDAARFPGDRFALAEGEFFVAYGQGAGSSKLTLPVIEKALGVRATGRNWSTVLKLQGMTH